MTYKEAHLTVIAELNKRSWKDGLVVWPNPTRKALYYESPDGRTRLWFKNRSMLYTKGTRFHDHAFGNAKRAMHRDYDIRFELMSHGAVKTVDSLLVWLGVTNSKE